MEEDLGFLFKQISERLCALANADLIASGITFSQLQVLGCLWHSGGETSQKALERELNVSHAAVAGLVSRLRGNGFAETRTDPGDRRNRLVRATAKAEAFKQTLDEHRRANEALLQLGLTPEERETLTRLLGAVLANLSNQ